MLIFCNKAQRNEKVGKKLMSHVIAFSSRYCVESTTAAILLIPAAIIFDPLMRAYEPDTLHDSNQTYALRNLFSIFFANFSSGWAPPQLDCWPQWKISAKCLSQNYNDTSPGQESNWLKSTFQFLLDALSTERSATIIVSDENK